MRRDLHSANRDNPIVFTPLGMSAVSSELHPRKRSCPIISICSLSITDFSELQSLNRLSGKTATGASITTDVRSLQPANVPGCIVLTVYSVSLYSTVAGITISPE